MEITHQRHHQTELNGDHGEAGPLAVHLADRRHGGSRRGVLSHRHTLSACGS
jgi:hypothetical protein